MKLKASLQVDVDGLWTIYRYHGIEREIWPDPVFSQAIPRFLALFAEFHIQATFFIVGIDTTIPEKAEMIKTIAKAGHEIANHSYSHPVPFIELDDSQIEKEIVETNQAVEKLIGSKPIGFRAPAYSINEKVIRILDRLGFQYDASIFPTRWARVMQNIEKKHSGEYQPRGSYGDSVYKSAPLMPYKVDLASISEKGESGITEIPVSVIPIIRSPMHRSLSQFLGMWYFALGAGMNRIFGNPLSLLFHGVELVERFQDEKIPKFKWVDTPAPQRMDEMRRMINSIKKKYEIVPTCQLIPV